MTEPLGPGLGVFLGIVLTMLLHAAFGAIVALALPAGALTLFLFIGATQFIYILPAWLYARKRGINGLSTGLVIGAAVTILLNGACFGLIMASGL